MNQELVDEIEYTNELLANSGFFSKGDIAEILEEQFIEEGVTDAFELFVHLKNNKYDPVGFCFYAFEDVEEAIEDDKLKITFGDFENNPDKALEIGKIVVNTLKEANFNVNWDETVNNQIEISIKWDKIFDENKEYEMEGAFEAYINNN